jgi:hypothetical protein
MVESACYEYSQIPSETIPVVPGASFSFTLNDQGRAGLSDKLGPAVGRVEGRYTGMVGDAYGVNVFVVETLGAGRSRWVGEPIQIPKQYVTGISARQLDKGKTFAVIAGAIAGVAALIASTHLVGSAGTDPASPPGGGSSSTRLPH